jgi:hypothetical protein
MVFPVLPFVATEPFEPAHPNVLALYCSDGRFTNSVEELLRHLGHPRVDTVTLPGGPALFNLWLSSFSESDAIGRGTSFLIEGHRIARVALLAHAGCGFYKARMPNRTPEQIHAQQLADLRSAGTVIAQRHPSVQVALYYALADEKVSFHEVFLLTTETSIATATRR